jgi:hypothetical protein
MGELILERNRVLNNLFDNKVMIPHKMHIHKYHVLRWRISVSVPVITISRTWAMIAYDLPISVNTHPQERNLLNSIAIPIF